MAHKNPEVQRKIDELVIRRKQILTFIADEPKSINELVEMFAKIGTPFVRSTIRNDLTELKKEFCYVAYTKPSCGALTNFYQSNGIEYELRQAKKESEFQPPKELNSFLVKSLGINLHGIPKGKQIQEKHGSWTGRSDRVTAGAGATAMMVNG